MGGGAFVASSHSLTPKHVYATLEYMAICNKCNLPIKFAKTHTGKWMPVNVDGSEHWGDCKRTTNIGKNLVMMKSSGWIRGAEFVEQPFSQIPPWEDIYDEIPEFIKLLTWNFPV